ncbi:MAG: FMN-binding glutamate synthase family protein [Gammaproteobacteria bacterium]|nr:MAG: FMN-binding glutamate synthase family protein [Gammaproteobacteria bacterium]
MGFVGEVIAFMAYLFVFTMGLGVLAVIVMYVIDRTQTKHAVRRNYPVVGRFRYTFEELGEFFRQYFFAMDREEMPFNRAERSWAYRAAKNVDNTVAFGSTRDLRRTGTAIFVNTPWPTLDQEAVPTSPVTIGADTPTPYTTSHFFHISGMSFGALSRPAVRALSKGAAIAGCWLNTGEGGLSPYHLEGGCDLVFQIGTAKYGVRKPEGGFDEDKLREVAAHEQVRMFEIKISQGAKPGKGGILPGVKVTPEIAAIRGIPAGQDSISPNRHPEIERPEQLLDMIRYLHEVTGKPVGFKSVIGSYGWVEDLFWEASARGPLYTPDFISVDSGDGGTGAAPMALMDNVGLSVRETLPRVVDILMETGMRDRVKVIAAGKLITPEGVAWALCAGADFVVSARGFMFALGCIQAMKCNRNTCPTGVTTHDRKLQRGLVPEDKAVRVAQYQQNMEKEVCVIAHSCGVAEPRRLRRFHCRMVLDTGWTEPLDALFPYREVPSAREA